jgi:hypothetical protein
VTTQEALTVLKNNPTDKAALNSIRKHNSKYFQNIVNYWFDGHAPEMVLDAILRRVGQDARLFTGVVSAEKWVEDCASRECQALYARSRRWS